MLPFWTVTYTASRARVRSVRVRAINAASALFAGAKMLGVKANKVSAKLSGY